jgi:hypothetical protein
MFRSATVTGLCVALCAAGASFASAATPQPAATASAAAAPAAAPVAAITSNATLPQFDTDTAAQKHCAADKVVWLNLNNNVYFPSDSRWYGHTKRGTYVCEKEADAAGDHLTTVNPAEFHKAQW